MKRWIDFSLYSSVKIGPLLEVEVIEEIGGCEGLQVIGHAYNLLLSPQASSLAVLGDSFEGITLEDGFLKVGAATPSGRVFSYAKRENLRGFEMLGALPGSVGGLVKMNAGMKSYEIKEILEGIITARGFVPASELGLGYRSSGIDEVIFYALFKRIEGFRGELLEEFRLMRSRQPKGASFGSVFKNPVGDYAGRLIEAVGLKGVKRGGAIFSPLHANFLINEGGASFEDAHWLIKEAQKRVHEAFGIKLEPEVVIL